MKDQLFVIAGPCIIEGETFCLSIADELARISQRTGITIIFKASFDKANRSSVYSFRGLGLNYGLKILAKVSRVSGLSTITDVHETTQVDPVAEVVDFLQIPAFLCRQTDLLCKCASTGKPINVKKGQFLSPEEMGNIVEKIHSCQNEQILLTERGTFFGYNRLVNDMTSIPIMKKLGYPVIFDATHSVQHPGELGETSGGRRGFVPALAYAATAVGIDGLFFEVHPSPERSRSDAACVLPLSHLEEILIRCKEIFQVVKNF